MRERKKLTLGLCFAAILCALIVLGAYAFQFHGSLSPEQAHWAEFGEYVGGLLGPLFALLAFVGLLWTIYLQRDALALQARMLREASFDRLNRTVFELLNDLQNLLERKTSLSHSIGASPAPSEFITFSELSWRAWQEIKQRLNARNESTPAEAHRHLNEAADAVLNGEYNGIMRLINKFFFICMFIQAANADAGTKQTWSRVLRECLSSTELFLVMIESLNSSKNDPIIKAMNDLEMFTTTGLPNGIMQGAPAYAAVFQDYFPHLPAPRPGTANKP